MGEDRMTTQDRIEQTVSAVLAKVVPDIVRIVENAVATKNEVVLEYLDAIVEANVSARASHLTVLKSELKSARERRRAKKS